MADDASPPRSMRSRGARSNPWRGPAMSFPYVDEPHLDDDPDRDPQETAFLHSIVEDPDDDAPRLIFADWLDEHGRPDKAAFVRLEVEYSREPKSSLRHAEVRDELLRLDE